MKLKAVLKSSADGGYTVYVPSLPGCISEGDTKEEAISNIKEAIELYLEPVEDDFTLTSDNEIMEYERVTDLTGVNETGKNGKGR